MNIRCLILLFVMLPSSGCTTITTHYYSFSFHNDSASNIYQPSMFNQNGTLVYRTTNVSYPFLVRKYSGLHTKDLPSSLESLKVRWKKTQDGEWIEKIIDVKSTVPKGLWGHIYVSVLADDSLALSWIMQHKHAYGIGAKDCGGYIFEHYYDEEAKVTIEKKMEKLSAYRAQKEKDIKAGLGDKYNTPKYYDTVEEADYRCNIYFYL